MSNRSTFFHYTAPFSSHLGSILESGVIRTTESNVSFQVEHAGPRVVWLLDEPLRDGENHGLRQADPKFTWVKTEIEIAVSLPENEVHPWRTWALENGCDAATRKTLMQSGGGKAQAAHWYVIERPIPRTEWLHILWRSSGEKVAVPTPRPTWLPATYA